MANSKYVKIGYTGCLGSVVFLVIIMMALWVTLKTSTRLEAAHPRSGYSYKLSAPEIQAINNATEGMTEMEIANYAMKYTGDRLRFRFKTTHDMQPREGNCITYAALCTAVANQGFRHNRMTSRARHDVGTIKIFGIDICNIAKKMGYGFLSDHDFVTITSSEGSYSIDPSIKSVLGFDLKTNQ